VLAQEAVHSPRLTRLHEVPATCPALSEGATEIVLKQGSNHFECRLIDPTTRLIAHIRRFRRQRTMHDPLRTALAVSNHTERISRRSSFSGFGRYPLRALAPGDSQQIGFFLEFSAF